MKWTTRSRFFLICASLTMVVGPLGQKALAGGPNAEDSSGGQSWLQEFAQEHYGVDVSDIFAYRNSVQDGSRNYVIWMKTPSELP